VSRALHAEICPFAPTSIASSNFSLSVTPKGGALNAPWNTNGLTAGFTVKNNGVCTDSINATAAATGPLAVASVSPSYFGLAPGASTTVWATYNATSRPPGSGTRTTAATT
jgi:hypothetical protein